MEKPTSVTGKLIQFFKFDLTIHTATSKLSVIIVLYIYIYILHLSEMLIQFSFTKKKTFISRYVMKNIEVSFTKRPNPVLVPGSKICT